jgi:hypothetical protein
MESTVTDREALTKLYQAQTKKLSRLESKLLKEPFRATELNEEINRQKGVIRGVGLSLSLLGKGSQYSFDDLLSMEVK